MHVRVTVLENEAKSEESGEQEEEWVRNEHPGRRWGCRARGTLLGTLPWGWWVDWPP